MGIRTGCHASSIERERLEKGRGQGSDAKAQARSQPQRVEWATTNLGGPAIEMYVTKTKKCRIHKKLGGPTP